MSVEFTTVRAAEAAEVTAPDGSAVRPLCVLPGAASFAQFELAPGQVSKAVSHAKRPGNLVRHRRRRADVAQPGRACRDHAA